MKRSSHGKTEGCTFYRTFFLLHCKSHRYLSFAPGSHIIENERLIKTNFCKTLLRLKMNTFNFEKGIPCSEVSRVFVCVIFRVIYEW